MSDDLGYVSMSVIPSFKGASQALSSELSRARVGTSAGETTGKQFGTGFSRGVVVTGRRGTSDLFETAGKSAVSSGLGIGRRAGAGITKGLKEYTKFAGASVAGYFAAEKVKDIIGDSISQASDLAESANKINVTFGSAADTVIQFAEGTATSLGLSELAARDAAATFGVFANSAGLSDAAGAKFSQRLVGLSADLASFYNTSPEQAIEAVGAALRGESEPLRAYGVLLDDATLRQEALRLGLVKTTSQALTPQQKVLAAYQVILQQTSKAQGDFGRTSDGLANQGRILSAEFQNLEASIGSAVLPVLTQTAHVLSEDVLPGMGKLDDVARGVGEAIDVIPGPARDVALALTAVAVAQKFASTQFAQNRYLDVAVGVETLGKKYDALGNKIQTVGTKSIALRAGAGVAGLALSQAVGPAYELSEGLGVLTESASYASLGFSVGGPWGAAIGGGIGLLKGVVGGANDAGLSIDGLTASVDKNTGAWTRNSRVEALKIAEDIQPVLDAAGISVQDYSAALLGNEDAFGRVLVASDQLPGIIRDKVIDPIDRADAAADNLANHTFFELTEQIHKVTPEAAFLGNATRTMGGQMLDTAGDVGTYIREVDKVTTSTGDAAVETQNLYRETLKLDNQALGIRGAMSNYEAAIDAVTDSLKENGHSLDITTEKGRANRDVLDSFAGAALEAESHMSKLARVKFNNDAHDKLVDLYLTFNDNATAAERYADRVLGDVVPALDSAKGHLKDTTTAAQELGRQKPTVEVNADTAGARADIDRFTRETNTSLNQIQDEGVQIKLTAVAAQTAKVIAQLSQGGTPFREGGAVGAIRGPGGGRDDLIPAMLSNGERVNREDIVTKLGKGNNARGQARFEAIERMILRGEFDRLGDIQPFANGGPVVFPTVATGGLPTAIDQVRRLFDAINGSVSSALSAKASHALTYAPSGGQLGSGGVLTPGQLVRGQAFAQSQAGKPYLWGGVGPYGYDCSGFQSAVLNSALGVYPYSRRGSTASMPWPGSAPGGGRYSIGWTTDTGDGIGHTSGNIGGLGVESRGTDGVVVGGGALSPVGGYFTGLMHYADGGPVPPRKFPPGEPVFKADTGGYLSPGMNHVWNGLGRREPIPDPTGPGSAEVVTEIRSMTSILTEVLAALGQVHVLIDNVGTLDNRARTISRSEDLADARHAQRRRRMGDRQR